MSLRCSGTFCVIPLHLFTAKSQHAKFLKFDTKCFNWDGIFDKSMAINAFQNPLSLTWHVQKARHQSVCQRMPVLTWWDTESVIQRLKVTGTSLSVKHSQCIIYKARVNVLCSYHSETQVQTAAQLLWAPLWKMTANCHHHSNVYYLCTDKQKGELIMSCVR